MTEDANAPTDKTSTWTSEFHAPEASSTFRLQPGSLIAGTYKVLEFISAGGMGEVYKCEELALGRVVALKTLQSGANEETILRFQTEGKAIAKLEHPNIVKLYGLQVMADGLPCLSMEYVPGSSLDRLLSGGKSFTVQRTLRIASQICEALKAAEGKGIIHRDLKPSNIMVLKPNTFEEKIKVLDFGIAKIQGDAGVNATKTGDIFGTPQYMSPEQALGKRCDPRTDQYSLGCILFEMLTGAPPFVGDNSFSVMMAHTQEPVPSVAKVASQAIPKHLEAAITKLLQKKPEERYATMEDATRAIFFADSDGQSKKRLWLVLFLAGLLIAGAAAMFMHLGSDRQRTEIAQKQSVSTLPPASQETTPKSGSLVETEVSTSASISNPAPSPDDKKLLECLKLDPQMKELDLGHVVSSNGQKLVLTQISDTSMRAIKSLTELEKLVLRNCDGVTPEGLEQLRFLSLKELNLAGTRIGDDKDKDKAIGALSKMISLENLDLKETAVTSDSCFYLSHLKGLKSLCLANTDIDARGLKPIGQLQELASLDLTRDNVKDGIGFLKNAPIKTLVLRGVALSVQDIRQLAKMTSSLRELNLSNTAITDDELKLLSPLRDLTHLDVRGCKNLTREGLVAFQQLLPGILIEQNTLRGGALYPKPVKVISTYANDNIGNLIKNGSFEKNLQATYADYQAGTDFIPDWKVTEGSVGLMGRAFVAADGAGSVELNGAEPGAIAQTFATKPGKSYVVKFKAAANPDEPEVQSMSINAAGSSTRYPLQKKSEETRKLMYWTEFSWSFKANSARTTLRFKSLNSGPCGILIDAVSVHPIK